MSCKPDPYILEPLPAFREYPQPEMVERARAFHADLERRRTVRDFDSRPVPREVIERCPKAFVSACMASLVADNLMPWDDPISKYVPEFQLYDEAVTRQGTFRDLSGNRLCIPRAGPSAARPTRQSARTRCLSKVVCDQLFCAAGTSLDASSALR
jgi:hypothetical protein